jgi:hypothetical protein
MGVLSTTRSFFRGGSFNKSASDLLPTPSRQVKRLYLPLFAPGKTITCCQSPTRRINRSTDCDLKPNRSSSGNSDLCRPRSEDNSYSVGMSETDIQLAPVIVALATHKDLQSPTMITSQTILHELQSQSLHLYLYRLQARGPTEHSPSYLLSLEAHVFLQIHPASTLSRLYKRLSCRFVSFGMHGFHPCDLAHAKKPFAISSNSLVFVHLSTTNRSAR